MNNLGKEFAKLIKEIVVQTMHVLLILFLIYSTWLYLFRREFFDEMLQMIGVVTPMIFMFVLYALITTKRTNNIKKELEKINAASDVIDNNKYTSLLVSQQDEMKTDGIAILSALVIVVLAKIMNNKVSYPDMLQAIVAVVAIYSTKKIYFKDKFSWSGDKKTES